MLCSAVFSNDLREHGRSPTTEHETSDLELFGRVGQSPQNPWKIRRLRRLHLFVNGYFYINLPSTLCCVKSLHATNPMPEKQSEQSIFHRNKAQPYVGTTLLSNTAVFRQRREINPRGRYRQPGAESLPGPSYSRCYSERG